MDTTKRMVVNTVAQYTKALINIVFSLYATRIVLDALSVSDYGIFSVVAGVVAMLSFITNALVITTQRYISFYHGRGDSAYVGKLFSNSLFLHVVFAVAIAATLLILEPWVVESVLTIEQSRLNAASWVYVIAVLMLFITIITAPFKALLIARENIVYISIVEVCDGVLKLVMALSLLSLTVDKLIVYALMMSALVALNFVAFVAYSKWHYTECRLIVRRHDIDKECIAGLTDFAGWTTFGAGTVAARNQGISIILNHFLGTVANAAYGIAFQVYGAVAFIATSLLNAMNPQIMKAEGSGDHQRTLILAERQSKYSSALIAFACLPLVIEMPAVLSLWIKDVPQNTTLFCRSILIAFFFDQITYGLHSANQATGKIGRYSLLMYTPKLLSIPLMWLLFSLGYGVSVAMYLYVGIELLVALARLPFIKHTQGLSITRFVRKVFVPQFPLIISQLVTAWLYCTYLPSWNFIIRMIMLWGIGAITFWAMSLDKEERTFVKSLIKARRVKES